MKKQGQKKYPSDISREQFEYIREELENVRKRTRPRTVDLYEVFCGLLYVLKSGCQWRMLPIAYVQSYSKKMGSGAFICLVEKMQKALEKLRKKNQYQSSVCCATYKKIMNRFLRKNQWECPAPT